MPKEEILTGIRNGLARGESVEQVVQTLIGAGYNLQDINEAANSLNTGVLSKMPLPQTPPTIKDIQNAVQPIVQQTTQNTQQTIQAQIVPSYAPLPVQTEKKKIPTGLVITLIVLGVFLFTLGGLILFGEKILDMFVK